MWVTQVTLKVGDIIFPPPWATSIKITCNYRGHWKFIYIVLKYIKTSTKVFKLILILTRGTVNIRKKTFFFLWTNFCNQAIIKQVLISSRKIILKTPPFFRLTWSDLIRLYLPMVILLSSLRIEEFRKISIRHIMS